MDRIYFYVGDLGFDGVAIMCAVFSILGLVFGIVGLMCAVNAKKTNKGSRILFGTLGSVLFSCGGLIGMAFFQ